MSRIAIDMWAHRLEAAYRGDYFHALRKNIESVRPAEWDIRPADWSAEEFGSQPELSICDLVTHVAGAKFMYADRAFGDASLEWGDTRLPTSRDMQSLLTWMDEGHRLLTEGLAALSDDLELKAQRQAPWRMPLRRDQLLEIVINHDLYHAGEVNRQRALIRGSTGWDRLVEIPTKIGPGDVDLASS